MEHLFAHAFSGINAFYTVLLAGAMLYWLGMIAGLFHLGKEVDGGDADLDADYSDADLDAEAEAQTHDGLHADHQPAGNASGETSFWYDLSHFFWPGKTPLTVGLSLLAIAWWTLSMTLTWLFNPGQELWLDLLLQLPVILAGFFVLKYLGLPVGLLMEHLQADKEPSLPGKIGRVILTVAKGRIGQVEVIADGGAPLLMSATTDGEIALLPGSRVLVLGFHSEDTLLVQAFEAEADA